jgi:hypothetical protein
VAENSPPGTRIIQLEASDDDVDAEQKISYKLISGNPEGFFAINTTTGMKIFLALLPNGGSSSFLFFVTMTFYYIMPPIVPFFPARVINFMFMLYFSPVYLNVIITHNNKGLITTTSRRLDRENQPEHILEVRIHHLSFPAKMLM